MSLKAVMKQVCGILAPNMVSEGAERVSMLSVLGGIMRRVYDPFASQILAKRSFLKHDNCKASVTSQQWAAAVSKAFTALLVPISFK